MTRKTALQSVGSQDPWRLGNPIFDPNVPYFDKGLNRQGSNPPEQEYAPVYYKGEALEQVVSRNMFSDVSSSLYIIKGNAGRGKTTFTRYFVDSFIRPKAGYLVAYCDALPSTRGLSLAQIEEDLREKLAEAVVRALPTKFPTIKDFKNAVIESAMAVGVEALSLKYCVELLARQREVQFILLCIDNLDECSVPTLNKVEEFISTLVTPTSSMARREKVKVLLPVRNYTIKRVNYTNHHAVLELPEADYTKVFINKLKLIESHLRASFKEPKVDAPYLYYTGRHSVEIGTKTLQYSKVNVLSFMEGLAKYVTRRETQVVDLFRKLASGDCKVFVECLYYFFHSCKLPHVPIFRSAFGETGYEIRKDPIPWQDALECLFAIHVPFYDVSPSPICNLFKGSTEEGEADGPKDFMNTLCTVRLLCRLCNLADDQPKMHLSIDGICREFSTLGYKKGRTKAAIETLLESGVLSLSEGAYGKYVPEDAYLLINESSRLYLNELVSEPAYLQYVCEDVFMESEYLVPIEQKYKIVRSSGPLALQSNRKDRLSAVLQFIQFLSKEEARERQFLLEKKKNYENFLMKYSIRRGGTGIRVSELLTDKTVRKVRWLLDNAASGAPSYGI